MKKYAFTLAEVLITLTIIGVIAALTIPNLMQKWSDKADVTKVKKSFAMLSQAVKLAVAENGTIDEWNLENRTAGEANIILGESIVKNLKVKESCVTSLTCNGMNYGWKNSGTETVPNTSDGFYNARFKTFQGTTYYRRTTNLGNSYTAILNNGMRIRIDSFRTEGFTTPPAWTTGYPWYGRITVDINGSKKPNQYGYDVFVFDLARDNLYPISRYYQMGSGNCNKNNSGEQNGLSCSTWVLRHGNMDYKYRDVSAEW